MRDPHVEALYYRLETGQQLAFSGPSPVERDADTFSLRLSDGQLVVRMKNHYATDTAARLAVEPYLRSWEIATALRHGPGAMKFVFERADVIDRDPPPPGAGVVLTPVTATITVGVMAPTVLRTVSQYPDPPDSFEASPDVVDMWERYQGYCAGEEPLPSMAKYVLTRFQQTEARHTVSEKVVSKLGYLHTKVGTPRTLRKREADQEVRPHTPTEIAWMEDVVRAIIRRVGEWAANPNATWPQITLKDFPPIEDSRRKPKQAHRPRASGAGRVVQTKPSI